MTVADDLERLAQLWRERHSVYGETQLQVGEVMAALFPEGLTIKTVHDFNRAALLFHVMNKLLRYCNCYAAGGHQDSLGDLSVYAAMLREIDGQGTTPGPR